MLDSTGNVGSWTDAVWCVPREHDAIGDDDDPRHYDEHHCRAHAPGRVLLEPDEPMQWQHGGQL